MAPLMACPLTLLISLSTLPNSTFIFVNAFCMCSTVHPQPPDGPHLLHLSGQLIGIPLMGIPQQTVGVQPPASRVAPAHHRAESGTLPSPASPPSRSHILGSHSHLRTRSAVQQ